MRTVGWELVKSVGASPGSYFLYEDYVRQDSKTVFGLSFSILSGQSSWRKPLPGALGEENRL